MELEKIVGTEVNFHKNAPTKTISTSGKILIGLTGMSENLFLSNNENAPIINKRTFHFVGGLGIAFSLVVTLTFNRYNRLLILTIHFSVICGPFVAPAFRKYCLPYVPATTTQLENILSVLKNSNKNGRLLDIGSGDGRIVVG